MQSWPQATAPVEQVFCWATTPLQFQSKLPQASGMVEKLRAVEAGIRAGVEVAAVAGVGGVAGRRLWS